MAAKLLEDYPTREEFAAEIGRDVRTVDKWRRQRKGPPWILIGGRVHYHRPGVVKWLEKQVELNALSDEG